MKTPRVILMSCVLELKLQQIRLELIRWAQQPQLWDQNLRCNCLMQLQK